MPPPPYDEIADWYENQFLNDQDPLGINQALRSLLGRGKGICLEIGCGTGIHATQIRDLGWTPVGIDLSSKMLSHAKPRLPTAQADAEHLPLPTNSIPAATAVMTHTDMPNYPAVLREMARVLKPGGLLAHIGVHPCFCGGFANRGDPTAVIITEGYRQQHWTKNSWTTNGIRDKVGATHWPLADLLQAFLDADLTLEQFTEGGTPLPTVLAVKARKTSHQRTPATR